MQTEKLDEPTALLAKKLQETKLRELEVHGAFEALQEKAKTCVFAHLHLLVCRALRGEFSLFEACLKMEQVAAEIVLPNAHTIDKTVGAHSPDLQAHLPAPLRVRG